MSQLLIDNDENDRLTVSIYGDGSAIITIKNPNKYMPRIATIHINKEQVKEVIDKLQVAIINKE